ncbi:DUF3139 domain-containing protein [Clostridium baratii]|uniref:DUF3139 domain-containing protein n=1 Tax=Clostridium baratii TaxID=1561 RepID=UPI0030D1CFF2
MGKKFFLGIIIILSFCAIIFLGGKLYFNGDNAEREKILYETVWKLSDEGYKKEDIESISVNYNPLKGGLLPYNVYVVFKKNPSEARIYYWTDLDKKSVENLGSTAAP